MLFIRGKEVESVVDKGVSDEFSESSESRSSLRIWFEGLFGNIADERPDKAISHISKDSIAPDIPKEVTTQ